LLKARCFTQVPEHELVEMAAGGLGYSIRKKLDTQYLRDMVSAHFIPIKTDMTVAKLAEIYIEQVIILHGILSSIVSDRDMGFTSKFWEILQEAL
jgi:hypothetical protein